MKKKKIKNEILPVQKDSVALPPYCIFYALIKKDIIYQQYMYFHYSVHFNQIYGLGFNV